VQEINRVGCPGELPANQGSFERKGRIIVGYWLTVLASPYSSPNLVSA
jgi:hypothetical protein